MSMSNVRFAALAVAALIILPVPISRGALVAFDNASQPAYSNGWQSGDNGGTGFGGWTLAYSGNTNGLLYPPQFIDTAPPLSGNSLGSPAFGLTTGDRRNQFETSEARRTFVSPLAVGQTFSADINGSALNSDAPAFTIGNEIELLGTNGSERFSLFTNNEYHDGRWTATGDEDTGIAPGNAFHIDFTLLSADSYKLVLSPVGGGGALFRGLRHLSGYCRRCDQSDTYSALTERAVHPTAAWRCFSTTSLSLGPTPFWATSTTTAPSTRPTTSCGARPTAAIHRATPIGRRISARAWAGGGSAGASPPQTGVPEPATLVLLMFAAAGWCLRRGRAA